MLRMGSTCHHLDSLIRTTTIVSGALRVVTRLLRTEVSIVCLRSTHTLMSVGTRKHPCNKLGADVRTAPRRLIGLPILLE